MEIEHNNLYNTIRIRNITLYERKLHEIKKVNIL